MPDWTGGLAEAGTSGQTEGSLVKKQLQHRRSTCCVLIGDGTWPPTTTSMKDSQVTMGNAQEKNLSQQAFNLERRKKRKAYSYVSFLLAG